MRILTQADEPALSAFLAATPETAMFLRSNLRQAGIVDRGQPYQGTYVGAFKGKHLAGVGAFYWNGNLMLQCASDTAPKLAETALAAASPRACSGVLGPLPAVAAAIESPCFAAQRARVAARQLLFAADLAALPAPSDIVARVRRANLRDRDMLAAWRHDYLCETQGAAPGEATAKQAADEIARAIDENRAWVLCMGDNLLAYAGFNATLPDMVQAGGLYTPPAERGLGYARTALHGALLDIRKAGIGRAVMFASQDNISAIRCGEALGFRTAGEYGLVFY
jgi:RimJ/RimL family protein N-acetyltransferase